MVQEEHPEKKDTYQDELLVANCAKIIKQSLAASSKQRPLTQTVLWGEACTKLSASCPELLACTVLLPPEPALVKEILKLYVNQED